MFNLVPFARRGSGIQRRRELSDIESMFENFLNDRFFPTLYESSDQIKVDIKEKEKEYVVEAEIPGFKKEDVTIELDEDRLTIAAQKSEQRDEEKENYIRKERSYSSMSRSFSISNVSSENIKAKFENGILTIILPKKEQTSISSKKIQIE